jgi:hypothetical protein
VSSLQVPARTTEFVTDVNPNVVTPADEFFFSLDGHSVDTYDETWRIEIDGIHVVDGQHWLQLTLSGVHAANVLGVTMRAPRLDPALVLETLKKWLASTRSGAELPLGARAGRPVATGGGTSITI